MATVFERVKKVTMSQLGVTENEVKPDSSFSGDLGADSLDQVELMIALEEEFSSQEKKVTIPDEESEKMLILQDVVDYLHKIGVSDIQAAIKPVEKSGFPRLNISKPSFSKPNLIRQNMPKTNLPRPEGQSNRSANAAGQRGGRQIRNDNRQRHDRQQGSAFRQGNVHKPPQQLSKSPRQLGQKPPETGNTSVG